MAFQKSSHFHVDAIINLMVHKVQIKGAIKMHVNSLKMSNIIEKNVYLESAIFNCSSSPQDNLLFLNISRHEPLCDGYHQTFIAHFMLPQDV